MPSPEQVMIAGSIAGSSGSGGNDAFTKLLLHMEGADQSTSFPDSSASNHTVVALADAQVDTAQAKFGSSSVLVDGVGDALRLDGSADFAFGNGDFTVDFWFRIPSSDATAHMLYDQRPSGTNGIYPTIYLFGASGMKVIFFVNSADRINGTTNVTANVWHHLAVARSGTATKLFLDGVQEGSTFTDNNVYLNGTNRPYLGLDGTNDLSGFNGWFDELRVSKGIARWTSNFTPPSAPYA